MICDAPSIMRPMTYTQPRAKSKIARTRRTQQIDDLFDLLKYRTVQSLNGHARNSVSLVFTSYAKGEGVSTMAVNFAAALSSERKYKVLLIDMNLENPSLHKIFAKDKDGDQPERDNDGRSASGPRRETIKVNPYLDVLVSYDKERRASTDGMKMEKFSTFLEKSKERYDFIVLDCPPLNQNCFSSLLATRGDYLVLVVESHRVRRQVLRQTIHQLESVGAKILGVILNKRKYPIPKLVYRFL